MHGNGIATQVNLEEAHKLYNQAMEPFDYNQFMNIFRLACDYIDYGGKIYYMKAEALLTRGIELLKGRPGVVY